ncbi:MAG: aspartate carbamoyltransferase catalytic subunit [Armatimonadota bacterium]|nr:aspartate carbamoyltransferase catalytic subunit [Armatimonadota bacterium]
MNLLSIREMEKGDIDRLLKSAASMKKASLAGDRQPSYTDKTVGLLFFEDSTRTRVGFEMAARKLGMGFTSFGVKGSSMSKGESLKDTVLTLKNEGVDGLVIRHEAAGAPNVAARFFDGPVINAGDGMHEHPTQALADAMTILEHRKKLEGLVVSIVGDVMHSRVARSNIWLLSKMGAQVRLVAPRTLMPPYKELIPAEFHYGLKTGLDGADVVMCLRMQMERMESGLISSLGEYASMYQVNGSTLRYAKAEALVMHPGPVNRGLELDDLTVDGKQSVINSQVENGVYVRMAVFDAVFAKKVAAKKKK